LLVAALASCKTFAAAPEPPPQPPVDAAPCMAAISASDDDRIVAVCGDLIDNTRTLPPDRLKALIARGSVHARRDQTDRAIADYDAALKLDPAQAALFNSRGELWRRKGDRPRAIRDFAAALRLDPGLDAARDNHKALALEIERLGADMALRSKTRGPAKPPLK
jgi:tetratricopeptide (TPR) repeat protein